jgi:hypothetical protein
MRGGRIFSHALFLDTEKVSTQAEESRMFEFWSIMCLVIGLPIIFWFAKVVDSKSDWDEDLDDTDVQPLLGVVAPKKKDEEEK